MFKKCAVLEALSVLTVTPALASGCPAKMTAIDPALANGTAKNVDKVKKTPCQRGTIA